MARGGRTGRRPEALGRLDDALAILADSGAQLSQEQLLDALWLATRLPAGAAGAGAAGAGAPLERARTTPAAPSPDTTSDAARAASPAPAARPRPSVPAASLTPQQTPSQQTPSRQSRPGGSTRGLYGAIEPPPAPNAPPPPTTRRALPLRVPEAKALRAELPIGRALRPLKQYRPNPLKREVDEVATATALAETGLPDVITRPARERWLDLALLVDDGMSMLLWRRLAVELRALLQRAGAFRVVRVLGLHTRGADAPVLRAKPYVPEAPTLPVTAVSDPSGHTLVLVLSDGVGAAWRDGRMSAVLERWAGLGPTAVMHALPPRLWEGSGIRAQRWQVRTRRPGSPGTDWTVTDPVLPPQLARFDGVPVPVLEPDAGPLADWARLTASASGTAVLPLLAPPRPRRPAATPSAPARPGDDLSRLMRFREAASPEAYRLAAHLAAVAPLPVPVMRLVQTAVEWQADTGHLAEVFLGGLMRPAEPPFSAGPGPFPPQQRPFTFTDTVRRALLGAVPLPELNETRELIGRRLKELAGNSPDFPAWLAHPSGADRLPAQARPFGTVEQRLAARLGATLPISPTRWRRWLPPTPQDPRTIGPYTLRLADHTGLRVTAYLGEDVYGDQAIVQTARDRRGAEAAALLGVQAEALRRMDGRYARTLLREHLHGEMPWIAEEPFILDRLDDNLRAGTDRWTPEAAFALARQLVDAVRVCAAEGMVHGDLTASTVNVADGDLILTGWSSACIDGVPSPARADGHPPTPEDNVRALGDILLCLGGGGWSRRAGNVYHMSRWGATRWRPIRDVVMACLEMRNRPTAQEVWEVFERFDPGDDQASTPMPWSLRERRGHGWVPLSDTDPQSLGPYTLQCHVRTRGGTNAYLGRGPDGKYAVLRTVDQESGRPGVLAELSSVAEALRRMDGRYAPKLLGQDLEAEPPWIAEEHVLTSDGGLARTLTALLSDGTADNWDARTAATIGMHVAEAVSLCSAEGMVHGRLTTDTVLVADDTVKLVGWQTAITDRHLRRWVTRRWAEDVFALGEILMALGGGRPTTRERHGVNTAVDARTQAGTSTRQPVDVDWAGSRWAGAVWEPLREMVVSCLFNPHRDPPTPREVADVFGLVIARTAPGFGAGADGPESERRLPRMPGSALGRGGPLRSHHRIAVLGLRGGTEAAKTTVALGSVFAEAQLDSVIAVDASPDPGKLIQRSQRESARLRDPDPLLSGLRPRDELRWFTSRTPDGLEILSANRTPVANPIDDMGYRHIMDALSERYRLALTHVRASPGTGEFTLPGVFDLADQLVIVWSAENGARPTTADAAWITAQGHAELLRRSIVVITGTDNFNPLEYTELFPHGECRAKMAIPYDPRLASDQQMDLSALPAKVLAAYRDLAALLAEGFTPPDAGPPA